MSLLRTSEMPWKKSELSKMSFQEKKSLLSKAPRASAETGRGDTPKEHMVEQKKPCDAKAETCI